MDVEKTIEFILEHEARADARLERISARVEQISARVEDIGARVEEIGALVKENSAQIRKLIAAQGETDRKLKIVGTLVGAGMKRLQRMERNIDRLVAGMMRQPQNGRRGR